MKVLVGLCVYFLNSFFAHALDKCTKDHVKHIEGWLFDLDGCIYTPDGLIDGSYHLFHWLYEGYRPFVLLSNSFRSKYGVAQKFRSEQYFLHSKTMDPIHIHTAAISLAHYLNETAPPNSKMFLMSTDLIYSDGHKENPYTIMKDNVRPELFNTWKIRTAMTIDEINDWAKVADKERTYVLQAFMGNPRNTILKDPVTGKVGYDGIDYDLLTKAYRLLRNGAHYVVGAPDVVDSQKRNPKYPLVDPSWPTMGGYEAYLLNSAEFFPNTTKRKERYANTGKGGSHGQKYMMEEGMRLLEQVKGGVTKDKTKIAIVGDNLGTDILAGTRSGITSILVLSGAHQVKDVPNWPDSKAACYLDVAGDIAKLIPNAAVGIRPLAGVLAVSVLLSFFAFGA